jgi:hypothetical protein
MQFSNIACMTKVVNSNADEDENEEEGQEGNENDENDNASNSIDIMVLNMRDSSMLT